MSTPLDAFPARLDEMALSARKCLMDSRTPAGRWEGELSPSALSTAVAAFALHRADAGAHRETVRRGLSWLAATANGDGGWGDTPDSPSNLSTTFLSWAALSVAGEAGLDASAAIERAEAWIGERAGSLEPAALSTAVASVYGDDRTFSAPILLMGTLAGRLGPLPEAWARVPQLPFEIAALPPGFFRLLRLPVVSYALPALIAIGLCRHVQRPARCPLTRSLRRRLAPRCLTVLEHIQPESGGYLEAAPLTGFVLMSLAACGLAGGPTGQRAARFLQDSERPAGCWPIDTNLSVWVSTLSVAALAEGEGAAAGIPAEVRAQVEPWLAGVQTFEEHPFTRAAPGGWAWTDLSGGVPDADDTAGALLALHSLGQGAMRSLPAAEAGLGWLLALQNRDGGFPTFCRGWGRLPFDRSCPDITAHAVRAFCRWHDEVPPAFRRRLRSSLRRAVAYLERSQDRQGFWRPLWFGNQQVPGHGNPVLGTARVLTALEHRLAARCLHREGSREDGQRWLLSVQGPDGGWGGDAGCPPSVEETALALGAAAAWAPLGALERGFRWMAERTAQGTSWPAAPIGLYFASLWYSERLYPLAFGLWGLGRLQQRVRRETKVAAPPGAGRNDSRGRDL